MKSVCMTLMLSLYSFFFTSPPGESPLLGTVSVTQYTSDYYYTISWDGLSTSYCGCTTNTNLTAAKNSFQSGDNWFILTGIAASGSSNRNTGPGISQTLYVTINYSGESPGFFGCLTPVGCSLNSDLSNSITGYTSSIYAPENVAATDGDFDTSVEITWTKGTDIPNAMHQYRIYRDGVLIHTTTDGNTLNYTNTGLSPGTDYNYAVTTYTTSFGAHESSQFTTGAYDPGSTFGVGLVASDSIYLNRTNLKWNDISEICDEIRVERSIPETANKEEIAILSKNATQYNDQDGIAGFNYTYYVTPISDSATWQTDEDTGYSRPNGKITGHVKSKLNAGVSGVDIEVELLSVAPGGGAALPANCPVTYCGVTDIEGYYEITGIYYYTGADFRVVPSKGGIIPHEFSPDTITRSLDANTKIVSGVDFTDLTVYTVGGRVTYPESSNNVTCGVEGVVILIDGQDYGVRTDEDGEWSFAIQEENTYDFEPVFLHHHFEDPSGNPVSSILINADNTDIDFEDIETDDLTLIVQAGCEASLGDSVEIRITSPNNCYDEYYHLDINGYMVIYDLPARDYSVVVTDIWGNDEESTVMAQIGNMPVSIDLTVRDTTEHVTATDTTIITPESMDTLPNGHIDITPADTMMTTLYDTTYGDVAPLVSFIYRSPLVISTNFEDAGAVIKEGCLNSDGNDIILMEQGESYFVVFEVKELLGVDCYIDTGYLKIYDFISDRGETPVTVPISGGYAIYQIDAGEPVVASNPLYHDHEKLLYIVPEVDLLIADPVEYWALVTGAKNNTPSFITRSPEIPMIILHDPPGDNSYAFIEQGTTFRHFKTHEVLVGGEAGVYLNLLLGAKVLTPFSGNGFGTQIKFNASAGRDNFDRNGVTTEITFNERFSTSDLENLTGNDGDVFIGAAFNEEYSLAQLLTFNEDSCKGFVDIIPAISAEDFATTFVYTEKHIRNTLLPTIGKIKDEILDGQPFDSLSEEDQIQVNSLIRDSLVWEQILEQNSKDRDSLAIFKENISFSAGAPISKENSSDETRSKSYEYNSFFNTEFGLGAKIDNESGIWFDSELGVMGKVRYSNSTDEGRDTSYTRTVGYVFDDNDIGDFFSVDILEDTAYGVPAFRLKLGTTSCPQESGTQARDRATINIFPPELTDISPGEAANFVCQVTNESESFETREYAVRVVGTTNPDGMIATLAGQWIGSGEGTFFLEPYQTKNMVLSFDQGPLASTYDNIGVMVYPICEYELWQQNGTLKNVDTAWITRIEWQTQCTDIALHLPDDGWLVNQQSNNMIHAAFTGYDIYNELFEFMTIQIKKEGEGYVDQITIDKDDITNPFYDVMLDVTNFEDGNYRLRAKAYCGIDGGITYSSEKLGTIDRSSIAPFGIPTPSDGFLREGQEVSVTFDKDINCLLNTYPNEITLRRADNNQPIAFTIQCLDNRLIIEADTPLLDRQDLDGVLVNAYVAMLEDLSGNVQEYPTDWSFLVNVSPVFWDPEELHTYGNQGQHNTVTAVLKNTSLLSKPFSLDKDDNPMIIDYPVWLTPVQTHGTILSNNDFNVVFDVSDDLTPGIYTGNITAMVDSLPVSMDLTFELLAKAVNWPFDATQYQYTMNMVVQFSLDGTNNTLSIDDRDLVAAFVNGQVRGITNIEYVPEVDQYRAFLTVYSNDQGGSNGEVIKFKFWRALTGVEYGALETTIFTLDNTVGTVGSPFILHPEGFFQLIPLTKGWNWISLNVSTLNMSREHIFENILNGPNGNSITVKSKTQSSQYSPQSNWSGNLTSLQLGVGYLVHLSNAPDTLKVVGLPSASNIAVNVAGSWNWIGFPRLNPEAVVDVLDDLTPTQGNILKSQDKFAAYDVAEQAWLGNLNFFQPGEGYKLFLTNPGTIFFEASRSDGYDFDPYLYEYNMNVTGYADLDLIGEREEEDFIIGAFIDGECRGTGVMEWNEVLGEYRILLLVNGNVADFGKRVEFMFKNEVNGKEYISNGNTLYFTADGLFGSVIDPYLFFTLSTAVDEIASGDYELEQSRPNPANDHAIIGFHIPATQHVVMNLFDLTGNQVKTLADGEYTEGRHTIQVDLSTLPKGVYFYEMKTHEFSGTKKMIRQ